MRSKTVERPEWLNKRIDFKKTRELEGLFKGLKLNTVCKEAFCPNIAECFEQGVATFLILGNTCTRGCAFCAVKKGAPNALDREEPRRVREAVKILRLKHVVITSVTRDDLRDGGAALFAETVKEIKKIGGDITVEALVPDFKGETDPLRAVIDAPPDILAHNVETVPRIYVEVRKAADYRRSLDLLKKTKRLKTKIYTKSGLMLGLGEREEEILSVMRDLREARCDFLSIGQYLSPSPDHIEVKEYIEPGRFEFYKEEAKRVGFLSVQSGPYVRSSYLADSYINPDSSNAIDIKNEVKYNTKQD